MNKIEELIQQLCPDGVKFRQLGTIVNILDNLRRPVTKSAREKGNIPYYGANGIQDYVKDFIFDGTYLLVGEDGSVINKDGSPVLNWATGKIWVNNHAHILSENKEFSLLRYIFFYLQTIDVSSIVRGTPPKINQQNLRSISIPIPPLPIQQEIVNILDKFTSLEAELEAELKARKKQYEYYRNELLNFEGKDVEWKAMGEVGLFVRGNGLQKNDFTESGIGCIHYGQIYTYFGMFANKTKSFVSELSAKKFRKAQKGDLIIATTSENVEDVCKSVVWLGDEDICISGETYIFKHKLNPKYIAYYLQTPMFFDYKKQNVTGTKVIRLHGDKLEKFQIPIPSKEEQERIVEILDKFDTLLNDISVGLPAEIKARRKQYEYYRGKLLTFNDIEK